MIIGRRNAMAASVAALVPALYPCFGATARPVSALSADDYRRAGVRGVGYGLLRFGNRSDQDHDALQATGADHVRVFLEAERNADSEIVRLPDAQLVALEGMLASLGPRGVHVVPVLSLGQDARGPLWKSAPMQDSAVALWAQVARRFRGHVGIGAFDIVNEPVPHGPTYAAREDRWLDFADRLVDAIRKEDPRRVLIVESAPDSTGESFKNMRPLRQSNLVYSVHSYAPFGYTHQGVMPEFAPGPRTYPETDGKGRTEFVDSLEPVLRFQQRHDVPIYVGEFSAPRWALDGSASRYVADSIALFERYGWSWSYHEFRAWHGWDAEIASPLQDARQRSADAPAFVALRAGLRAPRPR